MTLSISNIQRVARAAFVAIVAISCCSCRSAVPPPAAEGIPPHGMPPYAAMPPGMGIPPGHPALMHSPAPLPYDVTTSNWAPPGIARPWPENEYLRDGGDYGPPVAVSPDWEVYGLGAEDTVAHFDTIKGETLVEPSNKVSIYAPRFGAVRSVTVVNINEAADGAVGVEAPIHAVKHEDRMFAATSLQREKAVPQIGARMPGSYETRQFDGVMSTTLTPKGFANDYGAYENFEIIRTGKHHNAEKPRLAQAVQNAIVWTNDQAVQVILDGQMASEVAKDERVEEVYTVKDLRDSPKLRLIKVASTQTARPGDFVDFTLRFDNVGDQPLGNIVILDNLTTRLEYVPGSSQASVAAEFSTSPNEEQSHVLRWEIAEPLDPGEGGVIRFQCRVR